ncbi:hypothetical protein NUU61_004838 [Penicillium alfredii]|uniref:Rhodopsin domain-containing protein n=1 Tax=Penicillium alfredii TaxID=1506179 RepID=A0A9W9F8N0_9EURO|nr:uncharacterized protein NUU61_004838 [Penicillium alfredii]KAJ5095482.1 hypothetical protein NUU61_004838 [Penicillium alfredii]
MASDYASETRGPRILGAFWSLTILALAVVIVRLFIRLRVLRNPGIDDWLIVVGMTGSLTFSIVCTVDVSLGYGTHTSTIPEERLKSVLLLNNVNFLFGIMSFCIPKLAIVALLDRLFKMTKVHRFILWGLAYFNFVVSAITVIIIWTMCDPPKAQWDRSLMKQGAKCRDPWILVNYSIFNGALCAFIDILLGVYPAVIVFKLHMSLRKRLALCAALGMAAISAAMAVVKCLQLPGLADQADPTCEILSSSPKDERIIANSVSTNADHTADLVIWTSIESNVNILASCIPTLQPFIEIIFGRRAFKTSSNRYKQHTHETNWSSNMRSSGPRKSKSRFTTVDSQDSILQTVDEAEAHNLGEIRRTDQVTIEYGPPADSLVHGGDHRV